MPAASSADPDLPAGRLQGRGLLALLLSALLSLAGCVVPSPSGSRVPGIAPASTSLAEALDSGQEERFTRLFQTSEGAQAQARRIFANLSRFESLGWEGPDDALVVSSRLPGEPGVVRDVVRVIRDGELIDRLDGTPRNRWLGPEFSRTTGARVTMLAWAGSEPRDWRSAAEAAVGRLRTIDLGPLAAGWDGTLRMEVPASLLQFEHYLAGAEGAASQTAAATVALGDSGANSAVRIVVNPVADLTAAQRTATLIHEAVHLATRSPLRQAPPWVSEGLAEAVTAELVPGVAAENRKLARDELRRRGRITTLPTQADFSSDHQAARTAYALSQLLVEAMIRRLGRERALESLASLSGEVAGTPPPGRDLLEWLTAEIRRR